MAPIKFEDKLKDKLENRSIQPSTDAWHTLADRLNKEDKNNNTARFWWLGIAASIIGVVLVTTQFYKATTSAKDMQIVVETEAASQNDIELITESEATNEVVSNSVEEKEPVEVINTSEITSVSNPKKTDTNQSIIKKKAIIQLEKPQDIIASLETSKTETKDNLQVEVLSQEDLKIIEVVDIIKQLQANESSVSDKEIDSLLKQAQREILTHQIYDETTKTVSADALLQDVEVELEHSFRDKVFEALKSGYGTVKTAVAERHN